MVFTVIKTKGGESLARYIDLFTMLHNLKVNLLKLEVEHSKDPLIYCRSYEREVLDFIEKVQIYYKERYCLSKIMPNIRVEDVQEV